MDNSFSLSVDEKVISIRDNTHKGKGLGIFLGVVLTIQSLFNLLGDGQSKNWEFYLYIPILIAGIGLTYHHLYRQSTNSNHFSR